MNCEKLILGRASPGRGPVPLVPGRANGRKMTELRGRIGCNEFGRRIYAHLRVGGGMHIHQREFFGSRTLVHRSA